MRHDSRSMFHTTPPHRIPCPSLNADLHTSPQHGSMADCGPFPLIHGCLRSSTAASASLDAALHASSSSLWKCHTQPIRPSVCQSLLCGVCFPGCVASAAASPAQHAAKSAQVAQDRAPFGLMAEPDPQSQESSLADILGDAGDMRQNSHDGHGDMKDLIGLGCFAEDSLPRSPHNLPTRIAITSGYSGPSLRSVFKFNVCFCGLEPGNLKIETVRTHKQHICF